MLQQAAALQTEASASASLRERPGRGISCVAHVLVKQNRVRCELCFGHAVHFHNAQNADPATAGRRQVSAKIFPKFKWYVARAARATHTKSKHVDVRHWQMSPNGSAEAAAGMEAAVGVGVASARGSVFTATIGPPAASPTGRALSSMCSEPPPPHMHAVSDLRLALPPQRMRAPARGQ